jgi:hypothetical protein
LKSFAARAQTVPSSHAQRQARGRASRPWPAGLDQIKPQMLYLIDPQPYGSGFQLNVKRYEKLMELRFSEACTVGNGYHILIRIDLPNAGESRDLIKNCLAAMQGLVGTGKVEIDPKVFNVARIIESYGTMSCNAWKIRFLKESCSPWPVPRPDKPSHSSGN